MSSRIEEEYNWVLILKTKSVIVNGIVCDYEWFDRKLGSDFENGLFIFQSLQDREENTTKFVNNK